MSDSGLSECWSQNYSSKYLLPFVFLCFLWLVGCFSFFYVQNCRHTMAVTIKFGWPMCAWLFHVNFWEKKSRQKLSTNVPENTGDGESSVSILWILLFSTTRALENSRENLPAQSSKSEAFHSKLVLNFGKIISLVKLIEINAIEFVQEFSCAWIPEEIMETPTEDADVDFGLVARLVTQLHAFVVVQNSAPLPTIEVVRLVKPPLAIFTYRCVFKNACKAPVKYNTIIFSSGLRF